MAKCVREEAVVNVYDCLQSRVNDDNHLTTNIHCFLGPILCAINLPWGECDHLGAAKVRLVESKVIIACQYIKCSAMI